MKTLITLRKEFIAPNGNEYKAIWGKIHDSSDSAMCMTGKKSIMSFSHDEVLIGISCEDKPNSPNIWIIE